MAILATRRAQLAALAASATAVAAHRSSSAFASGSRLRVDAHAHALPTIYREALAREGVKAPGGLAFPAWSEAAALGVMRRYCVRAQVVSISDPGVEFLPVAESVLLAAQVNDVLADLVRRRPDRFAALAVLPARDIPASIAEARRALDDLALDGVGLLTHYDGVPLGDERHWPLLEELDRRAAYVFLHPTAPLSDDRPRGGLPDPIVEFPFETTRAVHRLLHSGALRRFPRIRLHLAHAGGLVPALSDQLARDLDDDISLRLGRLRYDTALSPSRAAMAGVRATAPVEQILFATDWPFTTPLFLLAGDPQPELARSFTPGELDQVLSGNILRELPRLAAAIEAVDG